MKTVNRHLGESTLQALLDGELSPPERAAAEAHLGTCPACAAELRDLRALHERATGLLARLDTPAPVAQAQMRMRARRHRAARAIHWPQALLKAAVLVLGFAGVAAAAVPGSPVRAWIESNVLPHAARPATPVLVVADSAAVAAPPADASEPTGVSIGLDGEVMRVVITDASPKLEIVAKLVDSDLAGVLARGPMTKGARFRTSPGRIEVLNAGAGTLEVKLPRSAVRAAVEVNGRVYVSKHGESLVVQPAATAGGGPSVRVGG